MSIHQQSGHPGTKRTLYLVRWISTAISEAVVKEVMGQCEACQSIDPAPVQWKTGQLDVTDI